MATILAGAEQIATHENGARSNVGRRGMRRLGKLETFIGNLVSVKDLHDNVASGKLYLIHRRLNTGKLDVNGLNEDVETALSVAINCGQKEAFRLLLKHGADPNIRATPKERSFGICENSPLWKTIKFRDLEWCQLLMDAGYQTAKDEEKDGWMNALRVHLKMIEKKKEEEGIDLTQDPFNHTYINFFQWYDSLGQQQTPPSLNESCRQSIRRHLLQTRGGSSIYAAIDEGLQEALPKRLRNYLLLQDNLHGENWIEEYKKVMRAFEKIFLFVDENKAEADADGDNVEFIGLNTTHG